MAKENKTILLIEDNPADARLMTELLAETGNREFSLLHADRISIALDLLKKQKVDLVLLDLTLPDSSGFETVRRMCEAVPHKPIIVLTVLEDDQLAIDAVQNGAEDYLVKDQVNSQLLVRSMRYAIERKKMKENLQFLAMHDSLTSLPNRALFEDRLSHALQRSKRRRTGMKDKWETIVMLLDLDDFKNINDSLGHARGDLLLQAVADRLQKSVRKSDTVARIGGDEFTLVFENLTGADDAEILANKVLGVFSLPFQCDGQNIVMTASIGISLFPFDGEDGETLLKCADIAMYQAKNKKNSYKFYINNINTG